MNPIVLVPAKRQPGNPYRIPIFAGMNEIRYPAKIRISR